MSSSQAVRPAREMNGLTTFSAIVAIAHPRYAGTSQIVFLDAQIYLGTAECEFLVGCLRYYNKSGIYFPENDDVGLYMVRATVCYIYLPLR
jgi:hypothetical protein